jgi:hypothetical protein
MSASALDPIVINGPEGCGHLRPSTVTCSSGTGVTEAMIRLGRGSS